MSQIRILIDESLPLSLVAALRRREPTLEVHRVGQVGMPEFGTSDPELLRFCDGAQLLFVSLDRATMPDHAKEHIAAGGHTAGVLLVTRRCSYRQLIDELLLIWSESQAEEWRDALYYLPL